MKLIKIPSSQGGLGRSAGAEKAPDKIVEELRAVQLSESGMLPRFDVDSVAVAKSNIEETNQNIYEKAKKELVQNQKAAFIGGDHSVTVPIFRAFSEIHRNAGIIIFDAHPDCTSDFATHEDVVSGIISFAKPENVILVGIRSIAPLELKFMKEKKLKSYTMKEISQEGVQPVCDAVMSAAKDFGALYLSIDIDVVDPAFAPGNGCPEPGGLSSRELLYFLQRINLLKNLRAIDLVEVNPGKDNGAMTLKLAAKIIAEI